MPNCSLIYNAFKNCFLEWTGTLLKFLKDQVPKLQEHYSQAEKPPPQTGITQSSDADQLLASRHWNYCTQLLKYMYEEGMFELNCKFNLELNLFITYRINGQARSFKLDIGFIRKNEITTL